MKIILRVDLPELFNITIPWNNMLQSQKKHQTSWLAATCLYSPPKTHPPYSKHLWKAMGWRKVRFFAQLAIQAAKGIAGNDGDLPHRTLEFSLSRHRTSAQNEHSNFLPQRKFLFCPPKSQSVLFAFGICWNGSRNVASVLR